MPKGPKGEKRPADVVSNAIKVARIATGEEDEAMPAKRPAKSEAAAELGKLGGAARAKSLTAKKRSEIAKEAAASRWKK
ncbi:MAG: RNA-binding protein [Chitinophagaceae bacterium]|nr:MAG: RNA-binding protein [Chitinophagaceae bacterium]